MTSLVISVLPTNFMYVCLYDLVFICVCLLCFQHLPVQTIGVNIVLTFR